MKRKIRISNVCCRLALAMVCLAFASKASAIELFQPVPLPDDGHGSTAQGWAWTDPLTTVRDIVGSKTNPAGLTVPVIWSYKDVVPIWSQYELPLPSGNEGEAIGGATLPDGYTVVVGNLFDRGSQWGVVWRKPPMGSWGMPQVLCQDSERSWVARADYCGDGILATAGSSFEDGRWRAVLHMVSATDVATVDLPVPSNSNSAALGIRCMGDTATHDVWAAGRVTDRQGRMHPIVWANSGQGWATFPIDLQGGAQGEATNVVSTGSGWVVCGNAMGAGRTVGFKATLDIGGHEISHGLLEPLRGLMNSSADCLSTDGGVTFGKSTNAGGQQVPTGWIGDLPFPARQLMHDGLTVTIFDSFRIQDNDLAVGNVVNTSGGERQAAVFSPTSTHVPDHFNPVLGNPTDPEGDSLIGLWHNDDNAARIRCERSGGMQKALLDLGFTPLKLWNVPDLLQYNVIARAEGNQPGASGTLNVYALNTVNNTWLPVGSFQLGGSDTTCTGLFPAAGMVNAQSGAVHLWLEFVANGNRPTALVCGLAQLNYMNDPTRDGFSMGLQPQSVYR